MEEAEGGFTRVMEDVLECLCIIIEFKVEYFEGFIGGSGEGEWVKCDSEDGGGVNLGDIIKCDGPSGCIECDEGPRVIDVSPEGCEGSIRKRTGQFLDVSSE